MVKTPIKAIIWDLDGTLIHFSIDFIKARKSVIKILKKKGVLGKLLSIEKPILENVRIAKEFLKTQGYSVEEIQKIVDEIDKTVIQIEYEAAIKAEMIQGIDKVLEFARDNNLKQAIFTYNTSENAEISLEKVNLLCFFEIIVGRDNIDNPKPHPDHLLFICNKLSVDPQEVLVIGDTGRDVEAALNVNAHSVGINTKISNYLKKESFMKADKIIQPHEIPDLLIQVLKELL